jgi:serine/threonine-protein kinase
LFLEFQRTLAGRFSLERELGRGGMGVVYLARDVALDRAVAIKLLPPILAAQPTFRERFLREARIAARLSHPHVVPIHSVEERGGYVYFVMAYVPGGTLGAQVRDGGPLRPDEAARILREVAWALGYAHAQGVVHRDVKPDNILLEEGTGRAMVTDFGIAQALDAEETSGARRAGTRGFMSPEQMAGAPLDGRSDLYALGLVGVYALTGGVVTEPEDAPRTLAVAPGWLRGALERCLAPLADDRFPDAAAFGEAVAPRGVAAKELPPALRVWLTRTQPLGVAASLWSLFFVFVATMMGIQFWRGNLPLQPLISALVFLAAPWPVLGLARLFETRRVLAAGYDLSDLRAAATMEAVQKREEFAYEAAKPTLLGRVARRLALVSIGSLFGLSILQMLGTLALPGAVLNKLGFALAITAVVSGVVGILMPGRWSERDVPSDLGARFWRSRLGRWAATLAGMGLARRARAADAMHRATEVLLGEELEDLFHALPAELRQGLEEVPGTIKRLTANAESLRAQVEAARALGQGSEAEGRLQEAVAALETVRVGLLRLRAGTVSLEGFTTDLDVVRQVGERVDRLVSARGEVDGALDQGG